MHQVITYMRNRCCYKVMADPRHEGKKNVGASESKMEKFDITWVDLQLLYGRVGASRGICCRREERPRAWGTYCACCEGRNEAGVLGRYL